MKNIIPFLALLATLAFACEKPASTSQAANNGPTETEKLNHFLDSTFDEAVARNPEWESRLGKKAHYSEWTDQSDAAYAEELEIRKAELKRMHDQTNFDKLDVQGQLSYRLFEEKVKWMEESANWSKYNYPVNQMHGVHAETASFLINVHRVKSVDDAAAYIQRVRGLKERMAQVEKKLKDRRKAGIIPPKFVFPYVLSDCRNLLKGQPFDDSEELSTLYKDFRDKVTALKLSPEEEGDLLKKGRAAFIEGMQPAYESLIAYLEDLEKVATNEDGAWKFPKGNDFYKFALRRTTTTEMGPEEIHNKGLSEVERIHNEMRAIMQQVGFEGDLQAFFEFMRTDPQFYYENSAEGKQKYLDEATAIIDEMREKLPEIFHTLPEGALEVRAVEAYREKSAGKAFYSKGAPDGSRPGVYYANLYDMANMPSYQMAALAYHEGIPGHHMQLTIAMELDGIPAFRRNEHYTAYIEGWGLYSEYLPTTMGFYKDPYSDFGRLAMELWRACRLVVDTGIHWKKWSRQDAIDYLKENTPNPEGDVVKAIERYIVMPSQATAYKIGMLKILELRAMAEKELGDQFDVRAFHDVILTNGAVPLNVLEELVQDWMKEYTS